MNRQKSLPDMPKVSPPAPEPAKAAAGGKGERKRSSPHKLKTRSRMSAYGPESAFLETSSESGLSPDHAGMGQNVVPEWRRVAETKGGESVMNRQRSLPVLPGPNPGSKRVQARESCHLNLSWSPKIADVNEVRRQLQDELEAKADILDGLLAMETANDRKRVGVLVEKRHRELYEWGNEHGRR